MLKSGRDTQAVLAGVVVFHPDPAQLRALVASLREQGVDVVLFFNSGLSDALRQELALPGVTTIEATSNLGVGAALNFIGLEACLRGLTRVLFFDQDSIVPATLVTRLLEAWSHLESTGQRPAVVSPLLTAKPGTESKAPTYRFLDIRDAGSIRQVAFVPTSGSLVATDVLRHTGFFRSDFFIDGIDLEWSFRAASQGYSAWVDTGCEMPHAVGAGVIGGRWTKWRMPKQRPVRMFCLVRNTLYGLRLGHIPLEWRLKQLAYLPVQVGAFALHHNLRWSVIKLLVRGVTDGIMGRLGPPEELTG